ncbi:MAG: YlbF family regulator [Clostridia bacterium]
MYKALEVLDLQNVYDLAHKLARAIKESDENRRYLAARTEVINDEKATEMVNDFRRKQMQYHARQLAGEEIGEEDRESLRKLREVLELHPEVKEFLDAEVRLVQLITDIQGILADAVEMDLEGDAPDEP